MIGIISVLPFVTLLILYVFPFQDCGNWRYDAAGRSVHSSAVYYLWTS